jgi:hypothetical protein
MRLATTFSVALHVVFGSTLIPFQYDVPESYMVFMFASAQPNGYSSHHAMARRSIQSNPYERTVS